MKAKLSVQHWALDYALIKIATPEASVELEVPLGIAKFIDPENYKKIYEE